MDDTRGKVTVAGLADLHVKETSEREWRDVFLRVSDEADVLALAGDLTDLGRVREAEILAEELRACTIPVVGVLGNHDYESGEHEEVERVLRQAGISFLGTQVCQHRGVGFAGVKGFVGGFGSRMLGAFGEGAIKSLVGETMNEAMVLENALRKLPSSAPSVVVLHYAPVEATVEGEPKEIYPFLGSSRLAETIDRFKVSAVIHGHAHRGAHRGQTPGGVPVYNCARHIQKENGRPYALVTL
jgi:Icc-related predicted phosphoesterase